jgi:hypothetical protein
MVLNGPLLVDGGIRVFKKKLTFDWSFRDVNIESDSKVVVNLICDGCNIRHPCHLMVRHHIHNILAQLDVYNVNLDFCEANHVVDMLLYV